MNYKPNLPVFLGFDHVFGLFLYLHMQTRLKCILYQSTKLNSSLLKIGDLKIEINARNNDILCVEPIIFLLDKNTEICSKQLYITLEVLILYDFGNVDLSFNKKSLEKAR